VTVQKSYSKQCRYCSSKEQPVEIFWGDMKKYFTDATGAKHQCAASSKVDQSRQLNETINDLKSQMSSQHTDEVQRIDSLQRSTAHLTSLVQEIKFKMDAALRNV
jgi:hypothetical protein